MIRTLLVRKETIELENFLYKENEIPKDINEIQNLSRINIFVGANNSGKSRFIRAIARAGQYRSGIQTDILAKLNESINHSCWEIARILQDSGIGSLFDHDIRTIQRMKIENDFWLKRNEKNEGQKLMLLLDKIIMPNFYNIDIKKSYINEQTYLKIKGTAESLIEDLKECSIGLNYFDFPVKYYIPTLRGLKGFTKTISEFLGMKYQFIIPQGTIGKEIIKLDDIYKNRISKDYTFGNDVEIFTGLEMYEKIKEMLLGNLGDRNLIAEYQKFIGEEFFDSQEVALIPKMESDVLYIKIGADKERPIYELGDGMQTLIILTFPMFLDKERHAWFFIEEPEIYLHPGYQRKLIEIMCNEKYGKDHQFFLTTHSNHLLELTADYSRISIFNMKRVSEKIDEGGQKIPICSFENVLRGDENILQELGVRNSSVFLSNCTIWVEGITDRQYIREYLKKYQKHEEEADEDFKVFEEDFHFSFVEYGGSNITHFSFLDTEKNEKTINVDRLCSKLFLIADYDQGKQLKRHKQLKEYLGDRYHRLKVNEIENLLPKEAILQVIGEYEGNDISIKVKQFDFKKYEKTPICEFIEKDIFKANGIEMKRKGGYTQKKYKTLKNKGGFCRKAIEALKKIAYHKMTKKSKTLVKKIYEFIKKNNS
ncbi:MAG: AAA family ATPase [Candidatus Eremiobacteraeota bacterium]|nr:AAA family ATPase [Candidatus Eremiobacteraeota bacterium]